MIEFLDAITLIDALAGLKKLPDKSVDCIVTSPPYYGLRNYDHPKQIGLEKTPEKYVRMLVKIFIEAKRVLKTTGTLWLVIGDSYAGSMNGQQKNNNGVQINSKQHASRVELGSYEVSKANKRKRGRKQDGVTRWGGGNIPPTGELKPKDLIGIPWMVAFALRASGWYLRQDIIWCLSGGAWVYARTQKGDMVLMVRELLRLKPGSVKLWNGGKWTPLLGISKSKRIGDELEIVLRSGERISCTPTHKFPTDKGLISASELRKGTMLKNTIIPQPDQPKDSLHIGEDAAWFAGLFIAEGSRSADTIQLAGHIKEEARWNRIKLIAESYGGSATRTISGNCMNIRVYGKILNAILEQLVSGRTAKDKCVAPVCWRYSNVFLRSLLDGYLSGDGHWDGKNNRWRIGFTRNYNLERDLRTLSARLGFNLTLKLSMVKYKGNDVATFRGEIKFETTQHRNSKNKCEIIEIRKARCREVYDLGVADEPHLFSLASGILTHNSKPNPMPESVRDRCTKSHEYIFLFSKSRKYYYDQQAIKQLVTDTTVIRMSQQIEKQKGSSRILGKESMKAVCPGKTIRKGVDTKGGNQGSEKGIPAMAINGKGVKGHSGYFDREGNLIGGGYANKKSVWTVPTKGVKEAHFATFPEKLIVDCIKAGCPEGGIVVDPFMGSGKTAVVSRKLNRHYIGFEINPKYIKIAEKMLHKELGMFK